MYCLALYGPLNRLGRPEIFTAVIVDNLEAADCGLPSGFALLAEATLMRASSLMRP